MSTAGALTPTPARASSQDANKVRERFRVVLTKANKEHPRSVDLKALKELLDGNKALKLWQDCMGMGELAENQALNRITDDGDSGHGSRESWKHGCSRCERTWAMTPLERLLIQQVTLCWLNLNLLEYRHVNIMKQSISLNVGSYRDKRLSMSQRRFTRACESLARVRRLSRRMPFQVNIASHGGQQINVGGGS